MIKSEQLFDSMSHTWNRLTRRATEAKRRRQRQCHVTSKSSWTYRIEPLEPRILLSADILPVSEPDELTGTIDPTPTVELQSQAVVAASIEQATLTESSLDVDDNGEVNDADAQLIIRHLFGIRGPALTNSLVDIVNGQRIDPQAIQDYLAPLTTTMLDPDANGLATALTDGLLIDRFIQGLTGQDLINGVVDPTGQRTDAAEIITFLSQFVPTNDPPRITAALLNDSGVNSTDKLTNDPTITGTITDIDGDAITSFRAGLDGTTQVNFVDIFSTFDPNAGTFTLNPADLDTINGGPLADGLHILNLLAEDSEGNVSTSSFLAFLLDTMSPEVNVAPTSEFTQAPKFLDLSFTDEIDPIGADTSTFSVVYTSSPSTEIPITSVDQLSSNSIRVNLLSVLDNANYSLNINGEILDLAGNLLTGATVFPVTVNAATHITKIAPFDGETLAGVGREIVVKFDRAIDPNTVDANSFQIIASGQQLSGNILVGQSEKQITFFPDTFLPASSEIRIVIDGDLIQGQDGLLVDADGDGAAGGQSITSFRTVPLTQIQGTNVEGFIFDANRRNPDGTDIPIEGVRVQVEGLPDLFATTDATGFFQLQNVPAPEFFVELITDNAMAPTGFQYAELTKPLHSIAGQTSPLTTPEGQPFDIFLPLMSLTDRVALNPGQDTDTGFDAQTITQLTEMFPEIDPAMWEDFQVTIPADSIFFDDGTPATSATVIALDPERIPAPLPEGITTDLVFSVEAGGAKNVDGFAQIEFPNLDGLAPGEKRSIFSFDHDAGEWIITGTAVVSDDGTKLITEGGGVNTLGWKFWGEDPNSQAHGDSGGPCGGLRPAFGGIGAAVLDLGLNGYLGLIKTAQFIPHVRVLSAGVSILTIQATAATTTDPTDLPTRIAIWSDVATIAVGLGVGVLSIAGLPALAAGTGVGALLTLTTVAGYAADALSIGNAFQDIGNQLSGASCNSSADGGNGNGEQNATSMSSQNNTHFDSLISSDLFSPEVTEILNVSQTYQEAADAMERSQQTLNVAFSLFSSSFQEFFGDDIDNIQIEFDQNLQLNIQNRSDGEPAVDPNTGLPYSVSIQDILSQGQWSTAELQAAVDLISSNQFATDFEIISNFIQRGGRGEFSQTIDTALASIFAKVSSFAIPKGEVFYRTTAGTFDILGRTNEAGEFTLNLPADQDFRIEFADPIDNSFAAYEGRTAEVGSAKILEFTPILIPLPLDAIDTDSDGTPDQIETVIGTNITNPDSDDDGISDHAELQQGLNPLDGFGFPTGIIASLPLFGEAQDIIVEGSLENSADQTAFIATGSHGLAIVDVSQFSNPIVLGQLDLLGDATDVAVDLSRNLAFVAAGNVGLHFVDITDPLAPQLVRTVSQFGAIDRVEFVDNAVIAAGRTLSMLNPTTGDRLDELALSPTGEHVADIASEGLTLYAVTEDDQLHSVDLSSGDLVLQDSIDIPVPPVRVLKPVDMRLFIANGVASIANGLENQTIAPTRPLERGGYVTFNVSDSSNLALISNIDTPEVQAGNLKTVLNGSGLALVAGGFRGLQIHGGSDPEVTYDLITEIPTPGTARSVAIAGGIAFVADDDAGLQVINYLPFDNLGQAPTVSIETTAIDVDPISAGIQVEEGTSIPLIATILDDVQMRNAELLVNGDVIRNDVSFPFDFFVPVPLIADAGDTLTIQVRATDTGGNATLSDPLLFSVIPDSTAPSITATQPRRWKNHCTGPTDSSCRLL